MKHSLSNTPTLLIFQNETIENAKGAANVFKNSFSTIGGKTQAEMIHLYKNYTDYLTNQHANPFFLSPTHTVRIKIIFSSLNISKLAGPHSIPAKV